MPSKKVLILVDSFQREYFAAESLRLELQYKGIETYISNRYHSDYAFKALQPFLVITPKTHKVPGLEQMHKSAYIALMQAESFSGNENAYRNFYSPERSFGIRTDLIDFVFCWGEVDKNFYKNQGVYSTAEIFKTGHPITDIWYQKKVARPIGKEKPVLGITTSINCLTHVNNDLGPVELIDNIERNWESGFFDPPYHAEDRMAFESQWLRIVLDLLKTFKDHTIYLRPHPLEKLEHYQFLSANKNIIVDNKTNIVDWCDKIDVLLSFVSTSQLDAYLRGVHVLSIQNLFTDRIKEGMPKSIQYEMDTFFESPKSIEEIRSLLLAPAPQLEAADKFVERVFSFEKKRPSSRIADEVEKILERKPKTRSLESGFHSPCFNTPWFHSGDLKTAYWDFRSKFAKENGPKASYCKHRIFRNSKVNQAVKKLHEMS